MKPKLSFIFFLNFFTACFCLLISFSFRAEDSGGPSKTILLIPYQRTMHLSDADADIADNSKISTRQVRIQMRNSVTEKISFALRDIFSVRLLSEGGTSREKDDLNNFYDSENFSVGKLDAERGYVTADTSRNSNPYFNVFRKNSSPDYNSTFMNVSLSKPVLFQTVANDYEADYFLVLTQLEIKTHYDECIDVANRIFRTEFRLHYAVFDAGGNQLGGSFATVDGGTDISTINKITENVFPALVKKISDKVALLIR